MKCIINGRVLLPTGEYEGLAIIFGEKIEKIVNQNDIDLSGYEVIDAKGDYVAPGLIDMHCHGYLGCEVCDGKIEDIKKMSEGIIKNGVTAWCPTTMTVPMEEIETAFSVVRSLKNSPDYYGSRILGVNSEGVYINPSKKGAQAEEHIKKPDGDFIIKHKDILKLFTIAPEVDGAKECIEKVAENTDVLISIGHTDATFEEANEAIKNGVRHTTHLFNAMTPLSHRSPGVVGAVLSSPQVSCELIADTFHVDKGLFNLIAKIKGDKLCLVTDCSRAGGMEDGEYTLGGQLFKKEGIKCVLPDGTIAGSVLTLNKAVYNLWKNSDLPLFEAVKCASENPAKALSEFDEIGSLEVGKRADIIMRMLEVLLTYQLSCCYSAILHGMKRFQGSFIYR